MNWSKHNINRTNIKLGYSRGRSGVTSLTLIIFPKWFIPLTSHLPPIITFFLYLKNDTSYFYLFIVTYNVPECPQNRFLFSLMLKQLQTTVPSPASLFSHKWLLAENFIISMITHNFFLFFLSLLRWRFLWTLHNIRVTALENEHQEQPLLTNQNPESLWYKVLIQTRNGKCFCVWMIF